MNKPDLKAESPPRVEHAAPASLGKLSETLFAFGEPLLSQLGDEAPLAARKQAMQLVITVWNAGAMALPEWGQPELLRQLERTLAEPAVASPTCGLLKQLLVQRRERFGHDPRAVGEWALLPEPSVGCVLRCTAHLPAGTTHARPARVEKSEGAASPSDAARSI